VHCCLEVETMKYFSETLFLVAVLAVCVLFAGDPDIVDGWAKRANATNCVE